MIFQWPTNDFDKQNINPNFWLEWLEFDQNSTKYDFSKTKARPKQNRIVFTHPVA